jgi:oxygen-dependent protoporphyrinogen oxidase
MRRVVVIGGGVSGLAAARLLSGASPVSDGAGAAGGLEGASVILLEASGSLGGKVSTGVFAGGSVELGPDQFLRRDPSAERLCRHLGLGDDLVAPAAVSAAVFSGSKPRRLPAGLVLGVPTDLDALAASEIVGDDALDEARSDADRDGPVLSAGDVGLDTGEDPALERSAGAILRARLGDEIVEHLVDPLLGGINAGCVDFLSLGTIAPQIAGRLVGRRDVVAPLRQMVPPGETVPSGETVPPGETVRPGETVPPGSSATESPFLGVVGGLGRLVEGLGHELDALGCEVRLGCPALGVASSTTGSGYVVSTPAGDLAADGIVLAVPAGVAAVLLGVLAPEAARPLGEITYSSVALVTFAFDEDVPSSLEGWSGILVPRVEGALTSAVSLLSQKWPWMASGSGARSLVRVSAGRHLDTRIDAMTDDELSGALRAELARYAGITAPPAACHVQRWPRSFPQFAPGHAARIRRSLRALGELEGLALAGAALGGIGIPACITSGERAAVTATRAMAVRR